MEWCRRLWMKSGVPLENEGWRLENRTCGAYIRTHYRQGGEEVVAKKTWWIVMVWVKLWTAEVMIHIISACRP